MSFVYIAKLIPQAGVTDESSQTSLAKQRNTEVCTIIDAHLNDRCYKRVPSIYPLPPLPTIRFVPPRAELLFTFHYLNFLEPRCLKRNPFTYCVSFLNRWRAIVKLNFFRLFIFPSFTSSVYSGSATKVSCTKTSEQLTNKVSDNIMVRPRMFSCVRIARLIIKQTINSKG